MSPTEEALIYNSISSNYLQSESASFGKDVIKERFKYFIEQEKPSSLLDLGCGSGVFALLAKKLGVEEVVGVDISIEQISLAKKRSLEEGLKVRYITQDISDLQVDRTFMAISSVFGFCYAPSYKILHQQLSLAYKHLENNGKVIAVVCHPQSPLRNTGSSYRVSTQGNMQDGVKLKCDFLLDNEIVATDYKYYWTLETWEKILKNVGFKDINWQELKEGSTNILLYMNK